MPRLTASSEEVKGNPPLPEGLVTVRLDGFKPRKAKNGESINLNPQLVVINSQDYNGRKIFDNLNTKAKWLWKDFCACFGVPLAEQNGNIEFPGTFLPEGEDDPEKWHYEGPLLGQTGSVYVVQKDDTKGGVKNEVKKWVSRL